MKVVFLSRKDLFTKKGGDTVQVIQITERLKELGFTITFDISESGIDIAHIFNTYNVDETLHNIKLAKKKGLRVVLTPIYHSNFFLKQIYLNSVGLKSVLTNIFPFNNILSLNNILKQLYLKNFSIIRNLLVGYETKRNLIFNNIDMLMPNSEIELEFIYKENQIKNFLTSKVIYNGVNIENIKKIKSKDIKSSKPYLLCIGRIEPLKNQLRIIEAFIQSNIYREKVELVFCGTSNNKDYFKEFLKRVNAVDQISYMGQLDHSELFYLLKNSKGLVHASWFETTGLIGLEAGAFGIPVIMTENGYTKSYFGQNVLYCNPGEVNSIKSGFNNIFDINERKINRLKKDIFVKYNWTSIANHVSEGYIQIYGK